MHPSLHSALLPVLLLAFALPSSAPHPPDTPNFIELRDSRRATMTAFAVPCPSRLSWCTTGGYECFQRTPLKSAASSLTRRHRRLLRAQDGESFGCASCLAANEGFSEDNAPSTYCGGVCLEGVNVNDARKSGNCPSTAGAILWDVASCTATGEAAARGTHTAANVNNAGGAAAAVGASRSAVVAQANIFQQQLGDQFQQNLAKTLSQQNLGQLLTLPAAAAKGLVVGNGGAAALGALGANVGAVQGVPPQGGGAQAAAQGAVPGASSPLQALSPAVGQAIHAVQQAEAQRATAATATPLPPLRSLPATNAAPSLPLPSPHHRHPSHHHVVPLTLPSIIQQMPRFASMMSSSRSDVSANPHHAALMEMVKHMTASQQRIMTEGEKLKKPPPAPFSGESSSDEADAKAKEMIKDPVIRKGMASLMAFEIKQAMSTAPQTVMDEEIKKIAAAAKSGSDAKSAA